MMYLLSVEISRCSFYILNIPRRKLTEHPLVIFEKNLVGLVDNCVALLKSGQANLESKPPPMQRRLMGRATSLITCEVPREQEAQGYWLLDGPLNLTYTGHDGVVSQSLCVVFV